MLLRIEVEVTRGILLTRGMARVIWYALSNVEILAERVEESTRGTIADCNNS
jgi:hypothetical protein